MIYYYYTHIIAKSIYTMKLMYEYTLFIPLYLEPSSALCHKYCILLLTWDLAQPFTISTVYTSYLGPSPALRHKYLT